jgi:LacI family transcriptional regulator
MRLRSTVIMAGSFRVAVANNLRVAPSTSRYYYHAHNELVNVYSNGKARMTRSSPTLHEVAEAAGVSIATVSRVVHGGAGVSESLRQRVRDAIDALGYRPSHSGRALVNRRHGAIGVVFPGLYGPYYSEVIHGIESVAVDQRIAVLILGTHLLDGATDHVFGLADRTDGLAVLGGTLHDADLARLVAGGKPIVLMAQHQALDLPTVRVDNHDSSFALTRHLLAGHGLRDLVFVGNRDNSPDVEDRWRGFVAAHAAQGLTPPDAPVPTGLEVHYGHQAGLEILGGDRRPAGVVCANDELALGVLSAARALDVRVPDDVAVTGWDDIPLAALSHPSLTTVRQPARALGARTAALLIDRIAGVGSGDGVVELPTSPVYRRSCGCADPVGPHVVPAQSLDRLVP